MIPGLERAEWVRFGQMHRNTFINAPELLEGTLRFKGRDDLWFAGQIVGSEGYVGSTASGLVAGLNAARALLGQAPVVFPPTTMLGALIGYVTASQERPFQPMKANFGLLPPLEEHQRSKRLRYALQVERSARDLEASIAAHKLLEDRVADNISTPMQVS